MFVVVILSLPCCRPRHRRLHLLHCGCRRRRPRLLLRRLGDAAPHLGRARAGLPATASEGPPVSMPTGASIAASGSAAGTLASLMQERCSSYRSVGVKVGVACSTTSLRQNRELADN